MMRATRKLVFASAAVAVASLAVPQFVRAAPYGAGDVLISNLADGNVYEYTPAGVPGQTLTTGQSSATGTAFDSNGNLYVTNFNGQQITKLDANGNQVGSFGSGFNADPESVSFNAAGDAFVGQADGSHEILEFDSSGNPIATFSPAVENRGTDWVDLASDQCTLRYTSEGSTVKQFDVCTNTQLPDFATGLSGTCNVPPPDGGAAAFELRQRPNGEVLVANGSQVVRLSSSGAVLQTYTLPGSPTCLFAMNLDPDGTSFWTADVVAGGAVTEVDIATGAIKQNWTVPSNQTPAGLAIVGELTAGGPPPNVPESPSAGLLLLAGSGIVGGGWLTWRRHRFAFAAP